MYSSQFITGYGSGSVYATDQGVVKVDIPDMSRHEAVLQKELPECSPSELTTYAADKLQRYFNGECIDFADISLDLAGLPPFRKNVLKASRCLRYGEICTYGQLAELCGSPHAARAVGGALASNPIPIIIPCHRVVAANGRLTGYSAPGGEITKCALLKMEGIEFKGMLVVTKQLVMNRNCAK